MNCIKNIFSVEQLDKKYVQLRYKRVSNFSVQDSYENFVNGEMINYKRFLQMFCTV